MRLTIPTLAYVAIATTLGCQSTPATHVTKAEPAKLPDGWSVGEDRAEGITLGVLPGWRVGSGVVPISSPFDAPSSVQSAPPTELNAAEDQLKSDPANDSAAPSALDAPNPMQSGVFDVSKDEERELRALRQNGVVLTVFDPGTKPIVGEQRTRYYVKIITHDGNVSLEEAASAERDYLLFEGTPKTVNLPIGRAARFESDQTTRGGDNLHRISFVVVDGPKAYCLRFISTNNPTAFKTTADGIAKSWRITPKR